MCRVCAGVAAAVEACAAASPTPCRKKLGMWTGWLQSAWGSSNNEVSEAGNGAAHEQRWANKWHDKCEWIGGGEVGDLGAGLSVQEMVRIAPSREKHQNLASSTNSASGAEFDLPVE
ncbi:hypothetical protein NDU88_005395 [Pleurodeles waltl]|uniref:Uncharacterized protein n=1 Tax=Pleurodeles waltl TaxID=8319 RepID=A0AAV7UJV2_PLEWA|nr:hypothetical protein NDU88_005395 [Pleurodeles waltl]